VTDQIKHYVFKGVSRLNLVAIGRSDASSFDFGVSLSLMSASTWDLLSFATYLLIGAILVLTFLYVIGSKLLKALKERSHTEEHDRFNDEAAENEDRVDRKSVMEEVKVA
jgi:hypothetical protein